MLDAASERLLQDVLRRESRSLLQYVGESFPWVTDDDPAPWERLRQLIEEEREALAELGKFLIRHHGQLPYLGQYPMNFTNYNNVAISFLRPHLIEHQRQAIARLEQDLARPSHSDTRAQLEQLLALKRRHLQALHDLSAPVPEPVVH